MTCDTKRPDTRHDGGAQNGIKLQNFIFAVGTMFVALVPASIALLSNNSGASWVALLSGCFVTLMAKFDSMAELSLGPLKARMRDVVAEATATLEQVRDLATAMAAPYLHSLIASSFMGGMSNQERFRIHDELIERLRRLGVSDKSLKEADAGWAGGVSVIYHRIIANAVRNMNLEGTATSPDEVREAIERLLDFPNLRAAPPDDFVRVLGSLSLLNDEVRSWIDDYAHFLQTGAIRRRPEFFAE